MNKYIMIIKVDKIEYQYMNGDSKQIDLCMMWEELLSTMLSGDQLIGLISNCSPSDSLINSNKLDELLKFIFKNEEDFKETKIAFVIGQPESINFPLYVSDQYPTLTTKVFHSQDSAQLWITRNQEKWITNTY